MLPRPRPRLDWTSVPRRDFYLQYATRFRGRAYDLVVAPEELSLTAGLWSPPYSTPLAQAEWAELLPTKEEVLAWAESCIFPHLEQLAAVRSQAEDET